jgi:hypothetical protein
MPSNEAIDTKGLTNGDPPAFPPNVFIFSPATPMAAKALLNGRMFTRLTVCTQTNALQLVGASSDKDTFEVDETFCLCHRNIVLIFDSGIEGKDLQDLHHEHFRAICLVLKNKDITLDIAGCVFDAPTALQAGFQLEELSSGSVLTIDIMSGDCSSDDDEDEPDEASVQWTPINEDLESTNS